MLLDGRQGAPANPCSIGISEPRCLLGYRTPYRYVNSAAYNMVARFPSDVSVPSFQALWQDGTDQGACYWPYFYPWGSWDGYSGYGYYPNFNFSNVPVMKPFLARLGGLLVIQNQIAVVMLKFLYLLLPFRLHPVVIPTILCPFLSPELLRGLCKKFCH